MKHIFLGLLFLALSSKALATTDIQINAPANNADLRQQTAINFSFTVNQLDETDAKIIVFRNNNNTWPHVNEIALSQLPLGARTVNVIPPNYFCNDVYAIRIMSGTRTLAGPVHFYAGAGICSSSDKNVFVNLENNILDVLLFKPANQLDRDTCGAFASAAALSAAYRRIKGHNVLLSQNYIHHIVKSAGLNPAPIYLYENQSSFWGGNSIPDALKNISAYNVPSVPYAEYESQGDLRKILTNLGITNMTWNEDPRLNRVTQESVDKLEYSPEHIPLFARQMAIYGVSSWKYHTNAEATNPTIIENYLKSGKEVILGLGLFWRASTTEAKTMLYDATGSGAHMMLIVGFDKTDGRNPYFLIKNSWGDGILRVHYDVIRNQTNATLGVIEGVKETTAPNPSRWIGRWEMQHDRWRGQLFIRRAYEVNLNRYSGYLRIGEYQHQNGKRYCAYGTWDATAKKLIMNINFNDEIEDKEFDVKYNPSLPAVRVVAKEICSPTASGQDFELNMGTYQHLHAYGKAIWNGIDFPAEIWR